MKHHFPNHATAGQLPNPSDVASIDSIIAALYEVVSGSAGEKRDWMRLRSLFVPDAKIFPLASRHEKNFDLNSLTVEGYIKRSGNDIETHGFYENEISRRTMQCNNLAHVFSTYECKRQTSDQKPFIRGVNSIQLMNDGTRWWIFNLLWEPERAADLIKTAG